MDWEHVGSGPDTLAQAPYLAARYRTPTDYVRRDGWAPTREGFCAALLPRTRCRGRRCVLALIGFSRCGDVCLLTDAEAADAGATDSKAADAEAAAAEAAAARAPVPGLLSSADLEYVYRGVPFPCAVVSRVLPAAAVRIHISIMRDTHQRLDLKPLGGEIPCSRRRSIGSGGARFGASLACGLQQRQGRRDRCASHASVSEGQYCPLHRVTLIKAGRFGQI